MKHLSAGLEQWQYIGGASHGFEDISGKDETAQGYGAVPVFIDSPEGL